MSAGEATGREHAKHAGVNWMADDSVRSALYQLVMFEDTRLQTPLFAESAHGGGDENQGCEHEEDDQRRDDVLRTPIDRQKRRERFARDHPGNGERKCLNEDRDHGAAISLSGLAAGSVAHKQEDRAENKITGGDKIQRPKIKPARHWGIIPRALPRNRAHDNEQRPREYAPPLLRHEHRGDGGDKFFREMDELHRTAPAQHARFATGD